jgi:fructose-1,6-bisphosphatase/inositol monophosphatase family enzyme
LPFKCNLQRYIKVPMYGCDCYAYGLLSSGFCDLVVEADLKPYDYMVGTLVPGLFRSTSLEYVLVN